jgi:hypothetical protein
MTPAETTAPDPSDAFARALAAERLENGRRICWLRFVGVIGFLTLSIVLGLTADPGWLGNSVLRRLCMVAAVLPGARATMA